jgi:tetratricopeptide (TPR) repeat protein
MSGRRDQHDADPHRRTEPTLGNIDYLDSPRDPSSDGLPQVTVEARQSRSGNSPQGPYKNSGSHKKPSGSGRGWLIPLLLLLIIAVAATAWLNQGWLRTKLPSTELNDVLSRAQQALQSGHLDGQDGTSARELFQQAAAQQPDNDRAQDGLHKVGLAELAQADAALQAGDLDKAATQAASARDLLGGGSDVDRLDTAITQARAAQGQAKEPPVALLAQAQQALADGKLDGPQGAGALYKQMLQADPNNAVAAHGLDQVGDALAVQAHKAFDANDTATANATVEELAALQPNSGALPALRALQAQTRKQDSGALDAEIKQGMEAFRTGRIVGPGDDTALAHFKAALVIDPDNAEARAGLGKVAQALTVQASAAIDAGDTAQATQLLDQAAALAPKSADLAAARARLGSMPIQGAALQQADPNNASTDDAVQPSAPVVLSPQQSAQIADLVRRAQAAASRGDIMLPPGNSAYDLYRNALVIDGGNAAALQGLQALPVQVEKQFNQALSNGNLAQASSMLDNLSELAPGEASQSALNDRLAGAWLDQAEQQLSSGDRIGATQSLDRARKLSPNQPRVLDLAARLQANP